MSYVRGNPPRHYHAIGTMTVPAQIYSGPTGSGAYPTADLAIYCPVLVWERVTIRKLYACNGSSVSGTIDLAVYDASGTRLVTIDQETQTGTNTEQVFDVTDTTIGPGLYYVTVALNNTTGVFVRANLAAPLCASMGLLTEQLGTGAALPATATWTVNQTLSYLPNIGFLVEATVA